jgi:predicted metal-dependent hydrolase
MPGTVSVLAYREVVSTPDIEVRRSRRRRRTVSAYRENGRTIVLIPARFTKAEERQWVTAMLERLDKGDRRRRPSDAQLARRAEELSERYLGGLARPSSIRWVTNQNSRWGSCTPSDGTIRISARVKGMPGYVLDYVILHELAHLLAPGHGPQFWSLLASYPRTERARGYLEGVASAAGLDLADDVESGHGPSAGEAGDIEPGQAALDIGLAE